MTCLLPPQDKTANLYSTYRHRLALSEAFGTRHNSQAPIPMESPLTYRLVIYNAGSGTTMYAAG